MMHLKQLIGATVQAYDGDMGEVEDALFDDRDWRIRYLVVDTGNWLSSHKVVLAPQSVSRIAEDTLAVKLSRDEIRRSLPAEQVPTVSSKEQELLETYWNYPMDWQGAIYPGGWGVFPAERVPATPQYEPTADAELERKREEIRQQDVHLRSFQRVKDYQLSARDDRFGHVEDLIVDEGTWAIRYLDVDTRNFLPSEHVFIKPEDVSDIDWDEQVFRVPLSRDQVLSRPEAPPA